MSREEAAAVYLDNLLGFSVRYNDYLVAASVLNENDKTVLDGAAAFWLKDEVNSIRVK